MVADATRWWLGLREVSARPPTAEERARVLDWYEAERRRTRAYGRFVAAGVILGVSAGAARAALPMGVDDAWVVGGSAFATGLLVGPGLASAAAEIALAFSEGARWAFVLLVGCLVAALVTKATGSVAGDALVWAALGMVTVIGVIVMVGRVGDWRRSVRRSKAVEEAVARGEVVRFAPFVGGAPGALLPGGGVSSDAGDGGDVEILCPVGLVLRVGESLVVEPREAEVVRHGMPLPDAGSQPLTAFAEPPPWGALELRQRPLSDAERAELRRLAVGVVRKGLGPGFLAFAGTALALRVVGGLLPGPIDAKVHFTLLAATAAGLWVWLGRVSLGWRLRRDGRRGLAIVAIGTGPDWEAARVEEALPDAGLVWTVDGVPHGWRRASVRFGRAPRR